MNDSNSFSSYFKRILLFVLCCGYFTVSAQNHSVARQWNEVLLEGIRNDFARPTVHARNLFHISAAIYDSWAVYDKTADTYFLGKNVQGFFIPFEGIPVPKDVKAAQEEAMSYACYRLINHRFRFSPGASETLGLATELMAKLGYDVNFNSTDYTSGSPASLGNYLAARIIEYGLQDGSNEKFDYSNKYYTPSNPAMNMTNPGSQGLVDPNHWQPLSFETFIDQSGNEIPGFTPEFISPEWGNVVPFSLTQENLTTYTKNDEIYKVYHDPGDPAYIDTLNNALSQDYKWNFSLVSIWSSHMDGNDTVLWDTSPGGIGNLSSADFPRTMTGIQSFYDLHGGDFSTGYPMNPKTGLPYTKQIVKRGDYARVLAEFWADGPDSETPPGHWFTILNYVNDHPDLEKKYKGKGEVLDDLEWDVKGYFALGGAMHDAAIAAWSIKGYYDYIRPISAIRYMAEQGQSSDSSLPNYSEAGLPLIENYIELVQLGDPLAGENGENIGKIKLFAWRGPDYVADPSTDEASVGWILGENWWPYQRPTFVTPPFAGYVSGHSTYSRAAAEILSLLTGDEYFPGGMGEFLARKNEFLVFENGPSTDIVLQWAKYYDASDQCSLSRIWGGIHPPMDDIPGRLIGEKIGKSAFAHTEKYFMGSIILHTTSQAIYEAGIYPNPVDAGFQITVRLLNKRPINAIELVGLDGKLVHSFDLQGSQQFQDGVHLKIHSSWHGVYILRIKARDIITHHRLVINH